MRPPNVKDKLLQAPPGGRDEPELCSPADKSSVFATNTWCHQNRRRAAEAARGVLESPSGALGAAYPSAPPVQGT